MADRWTDQQRDAINSTQGSILVSAAAGSGKTAVLVERIIKRITDEDNPCDIDSLLVVTFTKAAAAEMRERINSRLHSMLTENPDNLHLRRQKILLNQAKISTVHSFCTSLLREHSSEAGIPGDFRITDETELSALMDEAVSEILDDAYSSENRSDFLWLVEQISSERNDKRLIRCLFEIYGFISATPFPYQWLNEKKSMFLSEGELCSSPWGKILFDHIADALSYCLELNDRALTLLNENPLLSESYGEAFLSDRRVLEHALKCYEAGNWNMLVDAIHAVSFARLKSVKNCPDPVKNTVTGIRDCIKEQIKKLSSIACADEDEFVSDSSILHRAACELFSLTEKFAERLFEKKLKRHALSFSDLEQLTVKLLAVNDGKKIYPSALARELSADFTEILIDEYQDTNATQDLIFSCLSRDGSNLFKVGDAKQSIYRFRQAMPEIFLSQLEELPVFNGSNYPAKITLGKNFRSRSDVTETVNFLFGRIMSRQAGELDYNEEHMLFPGASYEENKDTFTELHIVDCPSDTDNTDSCEAAAVAEIILDIISKGICVTGKDGITRTAGFGDIAVLMRSKKNHIEKFTDALKERGIPVSAEVSLPFFETREVSLVVSLLKIIDNPVRDIELLSVLLSPLFAFSPDELTDIRLTARSVPLYSALITYSQKTGDEKAACFISFINKMRRYASTSASDTLLNYIYETTMLTAIVSAMPNGEARVANLRTLLEYARKYESTGYRGLSGFLHFLDNAAKKDSTASQTGSSADCVRIMSIHRSKGLEFPICIVSGLGISFNRTSLNDNLLLHPELGPGMKIRSNDGACCYNTLQRCATSLKLRNESVSEEIRILYVAMTRAREKLILTGAVKNADKMLQKLGTEANGGKLTPFDICESNSYLNWIVKAFLSHPDADLLRHLCGAGDIPSANCGVPFKFYLDVSNPVGNPISAKTSAPDFTFFADEHTARLIDARLNFEYPYKFLSGVPAKVTASALTSSRNASAKLMVSSRPAFMSKTGLTPSERGSAIHAFMAYCDLKKAPLDISSEIEMLVTESFISQEWADAIDIEKIRKFFSSELFSEMKNAVHIYREVPFSVELPASVVAESNSCNDQPEFVVLQGMSDIIFEIDGSLAIVDYKTDKVSDLNALMDRYKLQLELYKDAAEKIYEKRVDRCIIYSFELGEYITKSFRKD